MTFGRLLRALPPAARAWRPRCNWSQTRGLGTAGADVDAPLSLIVQVSIKRDRLDDFLEAMKIDAEGSRLEDGCLGFDVVQLNDDGVSPTADFLFYEKYVDEAAIEVHRNTPHYAAWADFRESGGVASSSFIVKGPTLFI